MPTSIYYLSTKQQLSKYLAGDPSIVEREREGEIEAGGSGIEHHRQPPVGDERVNVQNTVEIWNRDINLD